MRVSVTMKTYVIILTYIVLLSLVALSVSCLMKNNEQHCAQYYEISEGTTKVVLCLSIMCIIIVSIYLVYARLKRKSVKIVYLQYELLDLSDNLIKDI